MLPCCVLMDPPPDGGFLACNFPRSWRIGRFGEKGYIVLIFVLNYCCLIFFFVVICNAKLEICLCYIYIYIAVTIIDIYTYAYG